MCGICIVTYIYIRYYTGSRSVRLDICTSLTYFVESAVPSVPPFILLRLTVNKYL